MAICKLFDECCCCRRPADYFDRRRFPVVFSWFFFPRTRSGRIFFSFPDTYAAHMLFSLSDESFLRHQRLSVWRKIGEGSFSKVYVSQLRPLTPKTSTTTKNKTIRLIATKVINKNRVSAKFVEKFLPRELDVLLKLRHPFLVQASTTRTNRDSIPVGDLRDEKNEKDRKKGIISVHVGSTRYDDPISVRSGLSFKRRFLKL